MNWTSSLGGETHFSKDFLIALILISTIRRNKMIITTTEDISCFTCMYNLRVQVSNASLIRMIFNSFLVPLRIEFSAPFEIRRVLHLLKLLIAVFCGIRKTQNSLRTTFKSLKSCKTQLDEIGIITTV